MITTTKGDMDESLLIKKTGQEEDDEKRLFWTEYWLSEELVHRSVHVDLKQGIDFGLVAEKLI